MSKVLPGHVRHGSIFRNPFRLEGAPRATTPKPTPNASQELAEATAEYKELAARIGALSLIHHGSVVHRHAAAPTDVTEKKTGWAPFYQWNSKVNGKTVTRTLSEEEAKLYREWIENDRELRQIIKDMREASERATRAILRERLDSKLRPRSG
ncbi:hypothetical protein FQ154_15145 [Paeniglutamicibacter gangotriensis]|uniref:Uncharacterized protein n=1 Tax=Paeniglutamicibacter gangotriensis TaxID=254787 RepID=A0A5B0E6N8_9MICC|nr:DUF6788 family protein [Paeniglutamicibacter gangotriensis]KAA0974388.1 hypothetical protein FQ154_15145 [Paeniglutamicibacter gangotriensis]